MCDVGWPLETWLSTTQNTSWLSAPNRSAQRRTQTIKGYERVLRNRLLPRSGNRIALGIEPLEVEQWLRALKKEEELANPTLDKTRRVMSLVYKHGQRYGLIPRNQESNPLRFVRCKTTSGYEAMILTPEQAYAALLNLQEPERSHNSRRRHGPSHIRILGLQ